MKSDRSVGTVNILIVDDESGSRFANRELCNQVCPDDCILNINEASSVVEARTQLTSTMFNLVLLDYDLGASSDGKRVTSMSLIEEILQAQPEAKIYMITGHSSLSTAVMAVRKGAEGYLLKGGDEHAAELRRHDLTRAIKTARNAIFQQMIEIRKNAGEQEFVAISHSMRILEGKIKSFADIERPILILGETGLGKGVVAKKINRTRAILLNQPNRPFLAVNMASLSKDLAMSELFGYEGNAFTGANPTGKPGLFEVAAQGDLFLDEIGELSLDLQASLLKVIEEKEFVRVGGNRTLKTTARIICATNRDLWSMVQEGTFREDLYMRLAAFVLEIPSLDKRKEDIPSLVQNMLNRICAEARCSPLDFSDLPTDYVDRLMTGEIPGNIRGIENELNQLIFFSPRDRTARPLLGNWKITIGARKRLRLSRSSAENLKWDEFLNTGTEFLAKNFPGIDAALELFEAKLLKEATERYKTNRDIARALKIPESRAWRLLTVGGFSKKRKKEDAVDDS